MFTKENHKRNIRKCSTKASPELQVNEEEVLATLTVVWTLRSDTLLQSARFPHKSHGWPLGQGAESLEAREHDSAC